MTAIDDIITRAIGQTPIDLVNGLIESFAKDAEVNMLKACVAAFGSSGGSSIYLAGPSYIVVRLDIVIRHYAARMGTTAYDMTHHALLIGTRRAAQAMLDKERTGK